MLPHSCSNKAINYICDLKKKGGRLTNSDKISGPERRSRSSWSITARAHGDKTRMDPGSTYTMSAQYMGCNALPAIVVGGSTGWHTAEQHHYRNIGGCLRHHDA